MNCCIGEIILSRPFPRWAKMLVTRQAAFVENMQKFSCLTRRQLRPKLDDIRTQNISWATLYLVLNVFLLSYVITKLFFLYLSSVDLDTQSTKNISKILNMH